MPPFRDLTNLKFGNLTVKSKSHQDSWGRWYWLCETDDGKKSIVASSNLTTGHTKNHRKKLEYSTPNGFRKKIFYAWQAMKQRCYNPKTRNYKHYGGRGIAVCDEWLDSLQAFYDWATSNGCAEHLSIDRINNDGNYEPLNCRRATVKEQNNNQRRSKRGAKNGK